MKHSFFEKDGSTFVVFSLFLPASENNYNHKDVNIELIFEIIFWAFDDDSPYIACELKLNDEVLFCANIVDTFNENAHILDELSNRIKYRLNDMDNKPVTDFGMYERFKRANYFIERFYGYLNNDDIRRYVLCHIGV